LEEDSGFLESYLKWNIFGYLIGEKVGSEVPVIKGIHSARQEHLIGFGAGMATSGSVTLYHIEGVTPEAHSGMDSFMGKKPKESIVFDRSDFERIIQSFTTIKKEDDIDFVTLGCPHYNLEQLRYTASLLEGKKISSNRRVWICTSRMVRAMAEISGFVKTIEASGAKVIADTCPVESHMRKSTCRDYGLTVPNIRAMASDSIKMTRYVRDLIGCETALVSTERAIEIAIGDRLS